MNVMKYCVILLLVLVIDTIYAGNSKDDTDKDSLISTRGRTRQRNQYYAYINPQFTALTNRLNKISASVHAFRNQNKIPAYTVNLLRSRYTKPITSFTNNILRPSAINTIQGTLSNTLYQKAVVLNRPATLYQKAVVLNRPATINTIPTTGKLTPKVKAIYQPDNRRINTIDIKAETLPNRIVYTNPITGGKTIFVRDIDENTYTQPEKALNQVVQRTTPAPNSIVPLPNAYNNQPKIPYYQRTTPVPSVAPIVNYINPLTRQIRGDQNLVGMNFNQPSTVWADPIPAPNSDQPATTSDNQRPYQRKMIYQMKPQSIVTAANTRSYQPPVSNNMPGSKMNNGLNALNTQLKIQQTNQLNPGYLTSSNQGYTNQINPSQQSATDPFPNSNAVNFVRAFFKQLMQQHPPKNPYQIASSPTSKYNI